MARPPKNRHTAANYVNLRGEPIDLRTLRNLGRPSAQEPVSPEPPPVELAPADVETVYEALCLAGAPRGKTWLAAFLKALPRSTHGGAAFGPDVVALGAKTLVQQGRVKPDDGGGYDVPEPGRRQFLSTRLDPGLAAAACKAWIRASAPSYARPTGDPGVPPNFRHHRDLVALARLALHAGMDLDAFQQASSRVLALAAEPQVLAEVVLQPFDAGAFAAFDPTLRSWLLEEFHRRFDTRGAMWRPLREWLDGEVARRPDSVTPLVRVHVAERRLMRGDLPGMQAALAGLQGSSLALLAAAALAWQGRWKEADTAFAAAVKVIAAEARTKRGLVPTALLQWWVLALLAQPEAAAWTAARKLCVAESGSRKPAAGESWGLWAHAIAARLGDEPTQPLAFACQHAWGASEQDDNANRLVLAAWAGLSPGASWTPTALKATVRALHEQGQAWKADLVRQAIARLGWEVPTHEPGDPAPWPVAYFGSPREAWRDALAAIEALGDLRGAGAEAVPTLEWHLRLDAAGRVIDVEPHERSMGARGPGKARPVTLARVKKSTRLDPRDAAVARCIGTARYASNTLGIDVAGAAMALVNHPAVYLADAPWQVVELREGLPELDVQRQRGAAPGQTGADDSDGEFFVFRLLDPLAGDEPVEIGDRWTGNDRDAERERRNSIRIVREGAERARLIRVTPAQRRVAELVAKRWAVPVDAKAELDAALRVLAGHFQLHSDTSTGESVTASSRLRAQLIPRGDALQLRLAVRPFGAFGQVVVPGQGRPRLITQHEGMNLQTERDLAQESAHLQSVLDALPFLADDHSPDATWLLEDPEQALATLEALPRLQAVDGLDWPRGKPVRVTPVASKAVQIAVSSGRDWFAIDGEVTIDEGRVLGLQQLMQLAQASRQGRFVALGDGEYLALTDRLRQQLADLQALGQADKNGFRLPAAAAAFLSETLDGTTMAGDKPWVRRLALLEESAALDPQPPAALQAQLRGYQAEGYAWMSRLAHAGLGACLADDMGLGKTVQTLALLLSRAALGPALVIAPTSVCGNWAAEAARFAPSLRVLNYGEGDRQALLAEAGPGDLVIASYALVQIDDEAFGRREWATLVLDEAQALKNAATKRAKSIGTLQAGFRLALTGTPVENRLADLWSIMNLLNPGLLGSSGQFSDRFAGPIERQRDEAARGRLRRLVSAFLLRRTKAQVLTDLPPRTEIVHRIEPGPEERTFLEATRRSAVERIAGLGDEVAEGQAAFHVLAELTRLRRAACDPRLVAPELGIVGAKAQEFEQLALELVAGRHKALVFSQFTDFLKLLAERLVAAGISHQYLDGSTPAAERTRRVAAFQAGVGDLFLISLKAGGFGLNLTAADYVLIVDPWWNPAAEDQAMGRAHRIGQQRPVTVYRLVTAGSVEERIVALHQDKRALADGILEGQDQGRPIGAAELRELLGDP